MKKYYGFSTTIEVTFTLSNMQIKQIIDDFERCLNYDIIYLKNSKKMSIEQYITTYIEEELEWLYDAGLIDKYNDTILIKLKDFIYEDLLEKYNEYFKEE